MTSKTLTLAATAALATASFAQAEETLEMTSAFGQNLPILGTAAVDFVEKINGISSDVQFEHFDPGKLVPTLEALDAVSNGSVDAAFATSGYWQGKMSAASLFAAVPFGPEAGEFLGWILYDDGGDLWQQMYDDNGYDVKTLPCGIIAPETSGWFKKEITSAEDLQGLNMRFFGLGAQVMQRLGVSTSLLGASDIFPALERGAIDATEFSMPRIDARLGFHKIAPFNYFPGWHQPATIFELLINAEVYEDLSDTAKNQIEVACLANLTTNFAEGEASNYAAMVDNVENNGVELRQWDPEMLDLFRSTWAEVATEMASEDEFFATVWADLQEYREGYRLWSTNIYLPRQ
ncbi:TRAP transporter solute receptor, DctP family [Tritonibacter multivorans]|uniref:TRAP transporter solute receptor, DctP family n=1 Tax=Tritonibacter multivorans TaxID=928856 RepID=A0A0P1GAI9_9RHOB|nr:TRAP transporter substrate-binding protein [Tritonibacter multivorans]MDA7422114.1 TRAP transporter substrate-binding protein [Tritonibacter multivorans]CUH78439.1 TRAP transporter solute receptor, DctP family [Tritonibacter multivorans]SFD16891.1 TRAP-type mannitol/chloroaromatic compound transport system, substrate-binding protein [Tritonibacter multivorans]